jgi:hypothetical protein
MKKQILKKSKQFSELRADTEHIQELVNAGVLEKEKVDNYVELCQNFNAVARPVDYCERRTGYNQAIDKTANRWSSFFLSTTTVAGTVGFPIAGYLSKRNGSSQYGSYDPLSLVECAFYGLVGFSSGAIFCGLPAVVAVERIADGAKKKNSKEFARDYQNSVDALTGYSHEISRQSDELMKDLGKQCVGDVTQRIPFTTFSKAYASLTSNRELEGRVFNGGK